jgi:hypothetical protein
MALPRRRAARVVEPELPPAAMQAVCPEEVIRQPRARQRAASRGAVLHPGGQAGASACHPEPALPSGLVLCLEPVTRQPAERRDGRAVCSQVPALRSASVWLSGQQASRGALREPQASEWVLPWGPASPSGKVAPQEPLTEVQRRAAEASAWQPDVRVPPAAGEAVSVRAAAEPLPEAASVPLVQPAVAEAVPAESAPAEAAEVPDGSEAVAVAASPDVTARQPAGVLRADAAVQPSVGVPSGVRAPQAAAEALQGAPRAAELLALPSEAASVFRQGPCLAGPVQARSAVRLAHAMRSLRLASRSEPSWRAARNEDWSWW